MNVGSIINLYSMPTTGRVPTPQVRHAFPNATPSSPAVQPQPSTHGSSALFFSPDGDTAEISLRAQGMSLLDQNQRPAIPGIGDPQEQLQVESDMLKALETQRTCHTCENRRYVDQSNDSSVSYQTPTKISPNMAAAAVASHEQEHVRNEQAKAHRDDREIVSQTVTLQYDTCPECGKQYVSGGTTRTTSIGKSDSEDSFDSALNNDE